MGRLPGGDRAGGVSERLLTARQVAELLGVTAETVLRWTRAGELRGYRLPGTVRGRLRYSVDEVEGWLEQHATAGGADREALTTRADPARRDGAYSTLRCSSLTTPPATPATTEEDS
jgi:excisionase family DNA binding protein